MEHSILPPSSAARRMMCAGSRVMEAHYPDEDSQEAREGHAAHWVASTLLLDKFNTHVAQPEPMPEFAPNGEPITNEMLKGAELYVSDITNTIGSRNVLSYGIEDRVDMPNLHPESWGTPDYWAMTHRHLYIWDYKFGHKTVDVFENWQLIAYAAGILNKLAEEGKYDQNIRVTFRIVQPRSYHPEGTIREWSIMATDLRPYFNQLEAAEYKSMEPEAATVPGSECNYCTGRHACTALREAVLTRIDTAGNSIPHELNAEQTGNLLRLTKHGAGLIEALVTGLEKQAEAMLKRGDRVPHFRLETVLGRERWTKPAEMIAIMGQLFEKDLRKPMEVITPKQAIALGMPEEAVTPFVERPSGVKLIAEKPNDARKAFGGSI